MTLRDMVEDCFWNDMSVMQAYDKINRMHPGVYSYEQVSELMEGLEQDAVDTW